MIFLLPIIVIVLLVYAVDFFYFQNLPPKEDESSQKELSRSLRDANQSIEYLNKYIKK